MTNEPLGAVLSTLDADEARRFAELCAAYCSGEVKGTVADDGTLRFETTP